MFEDPEANYVNYGSNNNQGKQQRRHDRKGSLAAPATRRKSLKTADIASNIMKMNDLDFEELLECAEENIENSAFFASSVQLMGIIDGTISAIDDRLSKKKSRIFNLPSTKNKNAQQNLE